MAATTKGAQWNLLQETILFNAAGLPRQILPWAAALVWLESNGLQSAVAKANNNYSGIKWINKPYQVATKGTPVPKNEGSGFYAKYTNPNYWAKDFARILKLSPGQPINATSLPDFVHRLKINKYYGISEAAYLQRLQRIIANMASAGGSAAAATNTAVLANKQAESDNYKKQAKKFADEVNFSITNPATWNWQTWTVIGILAVAVANRR